MLNIEKMRAASYLLPDPGGEVVRGCLDEIQRLSKTAPIQGDSRRLPWLMHLRAYHAYCRIHGSQQALITGNCRGGFYIEELNEFIPGWQEELKFYESLSTED